MTDPPRAAAGTEAPATIATKKCTSFHDALAAYVESLPSDHLRHLAAARFEQERQAAEGVETAAEREVKIRALADGQSDAALLQLRRTHAFLAGVAHTASAMRSQGFTEVAIWDGITALDLGLDPADVRAAIGDDHVAAA